jgi:hypothetical protein
MGNFGITRPLLFVSALVHFTFRVNDEQDAKEYANEEEVFKCPFVRGQTNMQLFAALLLIGGKYPFLDNW